MNDSNLKLLLSLVLFGTWVFLVCRGTPGSEDLVNSIKLALAGLGVYHIAGGSTK